jgi:dihydroneopterin aldolase
MGTICLHAMQFHAFIGVYAEEQAHGNDFLVDVTLSGDGIHSLNDALQDTVDYVEVYKVVSRVMQKNFQLMESAVQEIISGIRELDLQIAVIKVKMAKLDPPIGGVMHSVSVEMEG